MIFQNSIVRFIAFFIPVKEMQENFIRSYSRKTNYRKLRDENIKLKHEIEQLKTQCRNITREYKYLNYKYALPEQRPQMLKDWYRGIMGETLDLENPQTFNEKIQWIKLNDFDELNTKLVDKYLVKKWVKEKIGEAHVIPLLGVYDIPDDINWGALPKEFVIKCNHGSGWKIDVTDKKNIDIVAINIKLSRWLNTTYGISGFELQYYKIPPKIIIEKKIHNKGHQDIIDYKFMCFNGKVKYIQVILDRSTNPTMVFYDTNWIKQTFVYMYPLYDKEIDKPANLNDMISIAEELSSDFKFVRVDLYRLDDGSIYFGEMTFTPHNGVIRWNEKDIDMKFGNLLRLK